VKNLEKKMNKNNLDCLDKKDVKIVLKMIKFTVLL